MSVKEQCRWIRESLTSFPQPPNRTNHNAIYGPIHDLFIAAEEGKLLVEDESSPNEVERWKFCDQKTVSSKKSDRKSVLASVLLRKLRWSTLGLQFEWSKVIIYMFASAISFFGYSLRLKALKTLCYSIDHHY